MTALLACLRAERFVRALCRRPSRVPIVLCVDAEPDPRVLPRHDTPDWEGFVATVEALTTWRRALSASTGARVRFAWFVRMDPQVALLYGTADHARRTYPEHFAALARAGDEIGLHIHPQRWDEVSGQFIVDHGNADWIDESVRLGLAAFQGAFGRRCDSFRFGDGWTSQRLLDRLSQEGVRFELTAEPGAPRRACLVPGEAPHTGELPGWAGIPTHPYRPVPGDYRREDRGPGRGLWILPMSSGTGPGRDPARPIRTLNLNLEPEIFRHVVDEKLTEARPYLGLMVRTDVALDTTRQAPVMWRNLEFLRTHPQARRFRFSAPAELIARLGLR